VRIVCDALIDDCLGSKQVQAAIEKAGKKTPTVLVGVFSNDSSEHLDTSIISDKMEEAILDSGKLKFVAGGAVRDQLRNERVEQSTEASAATAKAFGQETGADFLLTGSVKTMVDKNNTGTSARTYYVSAQLSDIESTDLLWKRTKEVKKVIKQPKARL